MEANQAKTYFKSMRSSLIVVVIFLLCSFKGQSQIVHETGQPLGMSDQKEKISWYSPDITHMEIEQLRYEAASGKDLLRFGIAREARLNPYNSGIISKHKDALDTWHMFISSENAASLSVVFSRFSLKEGEKVFIYDPGMNNILGPFTSKNNKESGVLPVVPLEGSFLIVEYQYLKDGAGELEIGQIGHDALGIFGNLNQKDEDYGASGPCNVDINCSEGDAWDDEKRAVVKLLTSDAQYIYLGSGSLVNNTAHSNIPYILTAYHVISTQLEANQTIAIFNYESPWCGGPDGRVSKSISGADLISNNSSIDFSLIELSEFPPILYKPYMAGWDVRGVFPQKQTCIHHPSGDVKKISYDDDLPIIDTFEGNLTDGFWKILQWDLGTTEGGSSGSPLFNENHLIIGTLTGGEASCGNSVNDYFARLDISYDYFPGSVSSLKPWLDINQTGAVVLNGRDPYNDNYLQSDTLFNGTESDYFLSEYDGTGTGLTTGFNSDSILSYAEKFTTVAPVEITDVFLYVGWSNNVLTNDSVIVSLMSDNGGPDIVLASETVFLKETKDTFMLRVDFSDPVTVDGTFYVTYTNRYLMDADADPRQFSVFHGTLQAPGSDLAWFRDINGWYPFSNHPFEPGEHTLYIKVVTVESSTIVSIKDEISDTGQVKVYPNPFNNRLQIESTDPGELIVKAKLIDLSGRIIRSFDNVNSNRLIINGLQNLLPGVYLLELLINDQPVVLKLVKEQI